jgi:hypothetical protein
MPRPKTDAVFLTPSGLHGSDGVAKKACDCGVPCCGLGPVSLNVSLTEPMNSAWGNAELPRMALDKVPRPELDEKLSGAPAAPRATGACTAGVAGGENKIIQSRKQK